MPRFSTRGWIGNKEGQIRVRNTKKGTTYVTFNGLRMEVDTGYYLTKLSDIHTFKDKDRFFKSLYWGTEEGRQTIQQRYEDNFINAIEHRYSRADDDKISYAIRLWKSMSPNQRDRFTAFNKVLVESVFKYEDIERQEIEDNFDWDEDAKQQNADIDLLIAELEDFALSR